MSITEGQHQTDVEDRVAGIYSRQWLATKKTQALRDFLTEELHKLDAENTAAITAQRTRLERLTEEEHKTPPPTAPTP